MSDEEWTELRLPSMFELKAKVGSFGRFNVEEHIRQRFTEGARIAVERQDRNIEMAAIFGEKPTRNTVAAAGGVLGRLGYRVEYHTDEDERLKAYAQSLRDHLDGKKPEPPCLKSLMAPKPDAKAQRAKATSALFEQGMVRFPVAEGPWMREMREMRDAVATGYRARSQPDWTDVTVIDDLHDAGDGTYDPSWWKELKVSVPPMKGLEPGRVIAYSIDPGSSDGSRAVIHDNHGDTHTVTAEERTADGVSITVRNDRTGESRTMFEPWYHKEGR